jgi:hypothetical protein
MKKHKQIGNQLYDDLEEELWRLFGDKLSRSAWNIIDLYYSGFIVSSLRSGLEVPLAETIEGRYGKN